MEKSLTRTTTSKNQIISRSARDFSQISKQIIRFASMTSKARISHFQKHPNDALCHIPDADGRGMYICGSIGLDRFDQIAKSLIEFEPDISKRASSASIRKVLIAVFSRLILKEKREINIETAAEVLYDATKQLLKSLSDTEHFLPCVLFHNGGSDEFNIGPVKFTRRVQFFRNKKQILKKSLSRSIESQLSNSLNSTSEPINASDKHAQIAKFNRNLQASALKIYRAYPWVAEVKIVNCDKETAERLASKTIEAALDVMRIMLGSNVMWKNRLASSRGDTQRRSSMWIDEDDHVHISVSSRSIGPVGTENWHDGLTYDNGHLLRMLGSAISALSNPKPIFHLHQRFLDSIHWFGDAATDIEPTSRVIKYTSGIERLIFGKYEKNRKQKFAARLKAIFDAFGAYRNSHICNDSIKVYNARSALLHGDWSPGREDALGLAFLAEDLCSACIICAGQLFPAILRKRGDISSTEWEELIEKFSKNPELVLSDLGASAA